jgi:uncharacterized protein
MEMEAKNMNRLIAITAMICFIAAATSSQTRSIFDIAAWGSAAEVTAAIKNGADVNARIAPSRDGNEDMTPLMFAAARKGDPEVISALIKAGADINAKTTKGGILGMTALMYAAINERAPQAVFSLLSADVDVNAANGEGSTALLFVATSNHNQGVAAALIKAGARIDAKDRNGMTALDWAVCQNRFDVVKEMVDAAGPAMTKALASSALRSGNASVDPQTVRLLLDAGADVNSAAPINGFTAILWGAASSFDVVDLLLKAGARVNVRDVFGQTPLIIASIITTDPRVVIALLNAGADPKVKDNEGKMAFEYALKNKALVGTEAIRQLEAATKK